MMRKLALMAAAVTLPVSAATVLSLSLGTGVAGAHSLPVAETCATSGSVTFAKPGLSNGGSLTTKTSELSKSAFAPNTGDAASCGTKEIKLKVTTATTACPQTGGVPNSGDPGACEQSKTNSKGVTTYEISKKPNYYDTTSGFVGGSTTQDIYAALAGGLKAKDNGASIVLEQPPSSSDVSEVLPGGACGANNVGFQVTNGSVSDPTGSVHNWSSLTCITTDTGTGTTGEFYPDLVSSAGGNTSIVIATAAFGGNSALTIS